MERAIVRKKGWIILTSLVVIAVIAVIGGKMYMDTQENKKIEQERKIAIQAKRMFKDIKEIKILDKGEASPGSIFFILEITNGNDRKYKVDLDLNDTSGYSSVNGNDFPDTQLGKTDEPIQVIYLSDKKEIIK